MKNLRKEVDMGFTRELFPEGTHMCLIYSDDEQRKDIIGRFLAKGLSLGEQVGYLADTTEPEDVKSWLKELGVALPQASNGFSVLKAAEAYCPTGEFIPLEMIDRLGAYYSRAIGAGYRGARVSGEMSWALRGIPGSERLMEYEALINTISGKFPVTPVCQYDARRFDGATLLNVLRVHPLMIAQGNIVRNPYYISPQEFRRKFVPARQ